MKPPNIYEAYHKLVKVINSCRNEIQFKFAERYADLFYEMYDDETDDDLFEKMDVVIAEELGRKRIELQ